MDYRMRGYVYLAKFNDGIYKIGSSSNPSNRFENLTYSYAKIGLRCEAFLWTTYSPYYKQWEIDFHRYFHSNRAMEYKGYEWFRFSTFELEFITGLPTILYYRPEGQGIEGLIETLSNHNAIMHSLASN